MSLPFIVCVKHVLLEIYVVYCSAEVDFSLALFLSHSVFPKNNEKMRFLQSPLRSEFPIFLGL